MVCLSWKNQKYEFQLSYLLVLHILLILCDIINNAYYIYKNRYIDKYNN